MRKRNNFISVFTMFLAIGFVIIFSRPVKAAANGVQLKANRTYTAYDVTGDGMKDKIRIRAANQTDDEAYTSLTVSVNGKTACKLKNTRFYNVIANIYTLKNGQPFLYLYAPADNGDGPVCALLKYTNGKFRKALDFTEIMAGYGNHRIGEVTNLNGNKIVITFKNIGSGLEIRSRYGCLQGFAIAGEDKKFYWAQGKLENNQIVVWSPEVPNPVAIRYNWENNPDGNLYNKEGLPACLFRTDTW